MKTRAISVMFFVALALAAAEPIANEPTTVIITATHSEFLDKLTQAERVAAGVEKLSPEQRATLDKLAAKEVRLARQGDTSGFAGTFISRRSEEERIAIGLNTLTTGEKYQLDRLVARALATPAPNPPLAITRPPMDSELIRAESPWETHGFIQLEYGFGSGDREYKAATVGVIRENPRTGTAMSFAYTIAEGDFWWTRPGCFQTRAVRP